MILRLLAASREVRSIVRSPTRTVELTAILDARDIQPGARVSFIVSEHDHDAGRLDAVTGCEFVDDRIRVRE